MKKKLLLFLLALFLVIPVVKAANYSMSDLVKTINTGDVTKAFEKKIKKEGCTAFTINAMTTNNQLNISYYVKCEETKDEYINGEMKEVTRTTYDLNGNIVFSYGSNGSVIESIREFNTADLDKDPFYERILQLTPYWGAEMSSKYSQIKKYIKNNHKSDYLEAFGTIFDRCYMDEMGVCYSKTPGEYKTTYTGKITMDDSGANYALKVLKKEQREIDNKDLMLKLALVAGGLLLVILFCNSLVPNKKHRIKY